LTDVTPHIVLEATGHYSKPLVNFFEAQGYPVVLLSGAYPYQKKRSLRKVKTDSIDALTVISSFIGWRCHLDLL